jgi:hypothetical protein
MVRFHSPPPKVPLPDQCGCGCAILRHDPVLAGRLPFPVLTSLLSVGNDAGNGSLRQGVVCWFGKSCFSKREWPSCCRRRFSEGQVAEISQGFGPITVQNGDPAIAGTSRHHCREDIPAKYTGNWWQWANPRRMVSFPERAGRISFMFMKLRHSATLPRRTYPYDRFLRLTR